MRWIWLAPIISLAWSCGGRVENVPPSATGDASVVDALGHGGSRGGGAGAGGATSGPRTSSSSKSSSSSSSGSNLSGCTQNSDCGDAGPCNTCPTGAQLCLAPLAPVASLRAGACKRLLTPCTPPTLATCGPLGNFPVGDEAIGIASDGTYMWVTDVEPIRGGGAVTELSPMGATLGTFPVGIRPSGDCVRWHEPLGDRSARRRDRAVTDGRHARHFRSGFAGKHRVRWHEHAGRQMVTTTPSRTVARRCDAWHLFRRPATSGDRV